MRGDIATAAKALADYGRATQLLPFKGGPDGRRRARAPTQIRSISRLPSREALYGQLVGIVASPISGLVRTLGGLVGGLAVALGQVQEKKESGEIPAGEPPAAEAESVVAEEPASTEEPAAEKPPTAEEPAAVEPEPVTEGSPTTEEPSVEAEPENQAEPEQSEPAQDDNQADVSAEAQSEDAETNPTKED